MHKSAKSGAAERKLRDRQARHTHIVHAARRIAEVEGWPHVTVRRLAEEIAYSQPVLYAHFESREGVVDAVAMEGFGELGLLLEKARAKARPGGAIGAVAKAYLHFASSSPAVYEAMFSRHLGVPFDREATPIELRSAFAQVLALFDGRGARSLVVAELFWASLHGVAELSRTHRLSPSRQKHRVRTLAALFSAQR